MSAIRSLLSSACLAAVLASAILVGCRETQLADSRITISGWKETEIAGIRVMTNAAPERAARILRNLREFIELARQYGGHRLPDEDITLHLFSDHAQVMRLLGSFSITGMTVSSFEGQFISLSLHGPDDPATLLQHEVTHLLLSEPGVWVPPWYNEGYAEFLGAAVMRPGVASLGGAASDRVETLRNSESPGLEWLLGTKDVLGLSPEQGAVYYAEAWAFIHYFHATAAAAKRVPMLNDYVARIQQGRPPIAIIDDVFGTSLAQLEASYLEHRHYLTQESPRIFRHFLIPEDETPIAFRDVPPLEAALSLADHAEAVDNNVLALALYDEALAVAPNAEGAHLGRAVILARLGRFDAAASEVGKLPEGSAAAAVAEARVAFEAWVVASAAFEDRRLVRKYSRSKPDKDAPDIRELEAKVDTLLEETFAKLETAVARAPECRPCWMGIAIYHADRPDGDAEKGLQALARAGQEGTVGLIAAQLYIKQHRLDEATRQLELLIASVHQREIAMAARKLLFQIATLRASEYVAPSL